MKRLILLAVSLALMLSCFLVNTSNQGVKTGTGFGFGEKIENPEELEPLLYFLLDGEDYEGLLENTDNKYSVITLYNDPDEIADNAFDDDEEEIEEENEEESEEESEEKTEKKTEKKTSKKETSKKSSEYESATMSFETSATASGSGSGGSHTSSGTRSMIVYITEDATFYRTKGQTTTKQTKSTSEGTKTYKTSAIFDMDIVRIDNTSYIYFREFSVSSTQGSMQVRSEYKGKWIEMPESFLSGIESIDDQNREALSTMGELIDIIIEAKAFGEGDKSIEVDENEINRLYKKVSDGNGSLIDVDRGQKMNFKLDFSSPSTPVVAYSISADISSGGYSQKVTGSQTITISNVNNTIVSFDDSCVVERIEEDDEIDEVFLIYEVEDED